MAGNLANLQKASAARTAAATARAEAALTAMINAGEPVTFRGLAARGGVSLDFLYRNTAIRTRIERHRSVRPPRPQPVPAALPRHDPTTSVVRTLTDQLADLKRRHREETTALRKPSNRRTARISTCGDGSPQDATPHPGNDMTGPPPDRHGRVRNGMNG
jgi:hypothetical protein